MIRIRSFSLGVSITFAAVVAMSATSVSALPLFGIGDCAGCQTWGDNLAQAIPNVRPAPQIDGLTQPELDFFTPQLDPNDGVTPITFQYVEPPLQTGLVVDDFAEVHDSLVMSWDPAPGTDVSIAAWESVYDVDPDLTGTRILFSIMPPLGVWDFSIALEDITGLHRGWFVQMPPTGVWGNFSLDPTLAVQPGFAVFIDQLGFDITQVTKIRLDEAGTTTAIFPAPNPRSGVVIPPGQQWNAWNSLQVVVPEPASAGLVLLGLAELAALRRRGT